MAKISKERFESLSDNAKRIVRGIDSGIDNSPLPLMIHNVDPSVEELCTAMEYIVESGWLSKDDVYARKAIYKNRDYDEIETGVYFFENEKNYEVCKNIFHTIFPKDFPMIIGIQHTHCDTSKGFRDYIHDAEIKLKLEDGSIITKKQWNEMKKPKQLKKKKHDKRRLKANER